MAYEEMVNDLARGIQKFIRDISKDGSSFSLVMLLKSPSALSDKWDLVVSSSGMEKFSRHATMLALSQHLRRALDSNLISSIDRISLVFSNDEFVRTINEQYKVGLGQVRRVHDVLFNAELYSEAIILLSKRPSPKKSGNSYVKRSA